MNEFTEVFGNILRTIAPQDRSCSEAETEANIIYRGLPHIYKRTGQQWYEQFKRVVDRTYEEPYNWYFLTFKPLDNSYDPGVKGVSKIMSKLANACEAIIVTRETLATKVHFNVLCVSSVNLEQKYHDKVSHHMWKMYSVNCNDYRYRVYDYVTKEALVRPYLLYTDYNRKLPEDFSSIVY